jgi:hypothetical protein
MAFCGMWTPECMTAAIIGLVGTASTRYRANPPHQFGLPAYRLRQRPRTVKAPSPAPLPGSSVHLVGFNTGASGGGAVSEQALTFTSGVNSGPLKRIGRCRSVSGVFTFAAAYICPSRWCLAMHLGVSLASSASTGTKTRKLSSHR